MLKQRAADRDAIQRVIARTIGMTASIYCYPTLEMLRFCKNQTYCRFDPGLGGRAVIDTLHQSEWPPFDRNFEGPRSGLLYTTAWLSLEHGHRRLAPASLDACSRDASVFTFFDLYGETIAEIDGRAIPPGGIELLGPHTAAPPANADRMQLACATHLVWFIGRTKVVGDTPLRAAVPSPILRLTGPEGTLSLRRPAVLDLWAGGRSDPFVDIVDRGETAQSVAPAFYDNLCRALAYLPVRSEDRHLARILKLVGLGPSAALDWNALPCPHRTGLIEGFEDAARVVCAGALVQAGPAAALPTRHHRKLERAIRVRRGIGIHPLDRAELVR